MIPYIVSLLFCLTVIHFYYNWRVQTVSIFLSLSLVIIIIMSLTHYFFCYGTSQFWLAVFFNQFSPCYLLLGPMLFFYVRGTLNDRQGFQKGDGWHFLPFLLTLALIFPYLIRPWDFKMHIAGEIIRDFRNIPEIPTLVKYPSFLNFIVRNISSLSYTVYSLWLVFRFESHYPQSQRIPRWHARSSIRFMKLLLFVCLAAEIMFTALYGMYFSNSSITSIQLASNPLMSLLLVGLSSIPLVVIFNPEVLYGIPRLTRDAAWMPEEKAAIEPLQVENISAINKDDQLQFAEQEERFRLLADAIIKVMDEQKPYLDPDFSIEKLADILDVPRHHLYYCFNSILHTRFTKFRSEYRVRHAQQLIREGVSESKTMEAIGSESGFSSYSSFRVVFRELTGMPPGEYHQSLD